MNEEVSKVHYKLDQMSKPKWALSVLALLLVSFMAYFPLIKLIESQFKNALKLSPVCAIDFQSLDYGILPPQITINNLKIPSGCFSGRSSDIELPSTILSFRGLSFSPIGPHFLLKSQILGLALSADITLGFASISFKIQESEVEMQKLYEFIALPVKVNGSARVAMQGRVSTNHVESLAFSLSSKNLSLPAQNINSFAISKLSLGNLLLRGELSDSNLKVKDLIVGNDSSPIRTSFLGNVTLNQNRIESSQLDLKGEVFFSEKFLEQYSIVGMLMNQFDKKDDYYQLSIKGTFASPSVK